MLTLPDSFLIKVKMTQVRTEPVTIVSDLEIFIHQEEDTSRKWSLHFFRMDLDEDTPITDVGKAYAERNLRPLPEHLLGLFIRLYPNFAKGYSIGTQHPASDCQPHITTTAFRIISWGKGGHMTKEGGWVSTLGAYSHYGADLKSYNKCTIWLIGLPIS